MNSVVAGDAYEIPLAGNSRRHAGSPLVLAIQGRYQEDPDLDYELPNTIQALLQRAVHRMTSEGLRCLPFAKH